MTLAVLACEPASAAAALEKAVTLRRAGTHFALAPVLEDVRLARLREHVASLCATYASWDEVRLTFDGFAATIADERTTVTPDQRVKLLETMRLADVVNVPSWSAHRRLADALGTLPCEVDVVVAPDPAVPPPGPGERDAVVVYAPAERADEIGHFVTALADLALPVVCVTRDAPTILSPVRFVPPAEAGTALAGARAIVDASRTGPASALALAAYGVPLAVSSVSGAIEVLAGTAVYDPWNRRSILAAVADALASSAPSVRGSFASEPRAYVAPAFPAGAPLISVVMATHDRPALLAETLAAVERQTYPNVEVVVVNDAGVDVRDVVARFPRARLFDQPQNRGPAAARNRGLAEARGEFAILFDDDDEMFPDHLASLARALLVSGLDVAYGQLINAFAHRAQDGRWVIDAYAGYEALLDHCDIQWAGSLATTAVMFRRALLERIGTVDETLTAAEDYEFWFRLAEGREWARVPAVTSLYFIRGDGSNRSQTRVRNYFVAHQTIYAKHPSQRALVAAGRHAMLELFAQTATPSG